MPGPSLANNSRGGGGGGGALSINIKEATCTLCKYVRDVCTSQKVILAVQPLTVTDQRVSQLDEQMKSKMLDEDTDEEYPDEVWTYTHIHVY